jgi:hypothetical protein
LAFTIGDQRLAIDPKIEHFVNNPEAMKHLRREAYRKPWVIDEFSTRHCLTLR